MNSQKAQEIRKKSLSKVRLIELPLQLSNPVETSQGQRDVRQFWFVFCIVYFRGFGRRRKKIKIRRCASTNPGSHWSNTYLTANIHRVNTYLVEKVTADTIILSLPAEYSTTQLLMAGPEKCKGLLACACRKTQQTVWWSVGADEGRLNRTHEHNKGGS